MNEHIKNITERIFEKINYSKTSEEAKEKIYSKLEEQYNSNLPEVGKLRAEGMVMQDYGDFDSAAELAHIPQEQKQKILSTDDVLDEKSLKKQFRRVRIPIYFLSVFSVFTAVAFAGLLIYRTAIYILDFFLMGIPFAVSLTVYLRRRKELDYDNIKLDNKAYEYLKLIYDRYSKRFINSMFLTVGAFVVFALTNLIQFFSYGYNAKEIGSSVWLNVTYFEYALFFLVKNILCSAWINKCFCDDRRKLFQSSYLRLLLAATVYWIAAAVIIIFKAGKTQFINNYIYSLFIIYLICCLVYDLTLRKNLVFKNITLNVKRAAVVSLCCVFLFTYNAMQMDTWFLEPYISAVKTVEREQDDITYNEKTGVYTITTEKDDFKILQLTDIHLGGSLFSAIKDYKALDACYDLINCTKPDLVIVTGDMVFPMGIMSLSLNNSAPIIQFASFMRNLGIPWAFTYGNHDTEDMANSSVEEIEQLYKSLSYKTSHNLLYPYVQPDITGRSNQLIEIRNSDGSLNQAVFLIDSNDYTGNGLNDYDYIHDDQVEWYKEQVEELNEKEGETVSSMLFFHIPLQQYRDAYELYEQGSDEVKYFFGENGETMINKVCCSDYPSKLFDTALELGSTKAMFCGHDHYNNMSLEYKGIRLTYGMSIDYLAMPGIDEDTAQRGATLITCHSDSTFDIEQVPLTSIQKNVSKLI